MRITQHHDDDIDLTGVDPRARTAVASLQARTRRRRHGGPARPRFQVYRQGNHRRLSGPTAPELRRAA